MAAFKRHRHQSLYQETHPGTRSVQIDSINRPTSVQRLATAPSLRYEAVIAHMCCR